MKYAVLALAALAAFAQDVPKLRLPGDVRPLRYDLELHLNPQEDGFQGHIGIDVEVLRGDRVVWLNSTGLKISKATVGPQTAEVVDGGREFIGLRLPAPSAPGLKRIDIDFSGVFNKNDVEGLFKQSEGGASYIYTQFEPSSARRAFPCFDEPAYKVPWKLTLHVPSTVKAFANTPQIGEEKQGDTKIVRFAESKPLPSYLVAMAVGPFDVSEAGPAGRNRIPVRTLTPRGRAADAAFVDQVTPKIIAALEDYFGLPYPYEKLDQVTIPMTVAFGAMENAGLITYRQTMLLARKDEDTIQRQRSAASVITHEVAHQWFGNMVTPMWWDDIWLNEAFATWMTRVILDKLFPEWKPKVSAVNSTEEVMAQDQLISARRIRQPIENHGDIGNAFDGITYQKGAAVIRMFEHYLGPDRFQKGIQNYMRKHAWGNATAADFLAAIGAAAGRDIAPAFSQYLDRGGLPVITVELKCDGGKPRLAVAQQRSLPIGSHGARNEYWPTPVCVRYEAGGKVSRECTLVSDPKDEIVLKAASSCPAWINANDNATGYYHVVYKGDLQQKLIEHGDQMELHERVALLKNTLALLRSGQISAGDAISLAKLYRSAPDRELVLASLAVMTSVERSVPASLRGQYAKLIRDSFGAKARELGWQPKAGESDETRLLRVGLLEKVASIGEDPQLIADAKRLSQAWLKDRTAVQPELTSAVLSVAARYGDRAYYEQLVAAAKSTANRRQRTYIIDALGSFRDPAIARSALGLMLTGEVDIRELTELLTAFQKNPETERIPWEFVTANYDKLLPRLPSRLGTHAGSILPVAGAAFCDEAGYREVETFFKERIRSVSGGARVLAKTLEAIELCGPRRAAQAPELERLLGN